MEWQPKQLVGSELVGDFPLAARHALLADALEHTTGHAKHCARSAVYHLGKGWKIRDADVEMALFRGLTAEEEATTAVMKSVKRLGYRDADLLVEGNHRHKAAMHLFMPAIFRAMEATKFQEIVRPVVDFPDGDAAKLPRLTLRSPVPVNGRHIGIRPQPPLHFTFWDQSGHYDFSEELGSIETDITYRTLAECVRTKANRRNQLLYAWARGIPVVKPGTAEEHLHDNARFVFKVLLAFVLVDRFDTQQLAVQTFLDTFLGIVAKVDRRVRDKLRERSESPGA